MKNSWLRHCSILLDTVAGELRLPEDKLQRLRDLLEQWGTKKVCRRKELESLMNYACKVVRPGHSFLHGLIELLHQTENRPEGESMIHHSKACRTDIGWWTEFVEGWNGVSFLQPPQSLPMVEIATDASGTWVCGAWHNTSWF